MTTWATGTPQNDRFFAPAIDFAKLRFGQQPGNGLIPPGSGTSVTTPPATSADYLPPAESSITTPSASQAGEAFAPLLDTLHGIGRPTIEPFAPIAPRFEGMAPVAIARPANSYYENLYAAKLNPLSQDYFGRGGESDQAIGSLNRRGLMTAGPSGVAGQLYQKTITDPFAREAANIQNQTNIIRTETEMDLAKYDATRQDEFRKFQGDLILKDRDYGIQSVEAQARVDNTYLALESEIMTAIANGATTEKMGELNARVNTMQALIAAETAKAQIEKDNAIEWARLEEERLARKGNFWINASGTPGAISGSTPFEPLDQPRPNAIDENRNPSSGGAAGSAGGVSTPVTQTESPGQNGAPAMEGTYDRQISNGWTWSSKLGKWVK
jgi:hypothetical protein